MPLSARSDEPAACSERDRIVHLFKTASLSVRAGSLKVMFVLHQHVNATFCDQIHVVSTVGAACVCVCRSIQAATCSGCTAVIELTPALAHQARKSPAARA